MEMRRKDDDGCKYAAKNVEMKNKAVSYPPLYTCAAF
jgi:hypothetical protein